MIIIWIMLSVANAFMAGMQYSLILTYQQDGKPVSFKQYVWVALGLTCALALQVAIVGRASQL